MAALSTAILAAAAAGAATSIYSANKAASAQKSAAAQATATANKQAKAADEATNRANSKRPDVGAMLSANQQAAASGNASTMLTGPMGVDTSQLQLGKNTLLGS
jgi:septal ring factor EnvC (AmiA/AmiB activator)